MKHLTARWSVGFAMLMLAASAFAAQLPDFTKIVQENAPAVVHVEAKYDGTAQPQQSSNTDPQFRQLPPGVPEIFRHFFGQPTIPQGEEAHIAIGSGFIISSDGYILTNAHVVQGADKVTVRLRDRRVLKAKIVGTDKPYDIALLKVDADDLPTVEIGDSSTLKPGQWVLAIGSPFDFDYTVTQGIVSAVGRSFGSQDQADVPFIQTDVPINHGNSGGPLFNLEGKVVGINSQIYSSTGGYMGVSFSIPINIAMNAVHQIKEKGYVSRGMIGVMIQQVDASKAKALGLPRASGALIAKVNDDSPGEKAGLKVGDVIQKFNGKVVNTASALPPMVAATKPGTVVTLTIYRHGKEMEVKVKLGAKSRDHDTSSSRHGSHSSGGSVLGFSVQSMTDDQRDAMDIKDGQGVVIDRITGDQASEAGLRPGDVILMIGQDPVTGVKNFKKQVDDLKAGDTVLLLVRSRDGNTGFVTVTIPEKK